MPAFKTIQVPSKVRMFELLQQGNIGNTLRVWNSPDDLRRDVCAGYDGLIGVRCSGKPGLPYFHHRTPEEGIAIGAELLSQGIRPIYYEASRDEWILIQGEVAQTELGLHLRASTVKADMRVALKKAKYYWGLSAKIILDQYFWESSRAELETLFEVYPNAVIEFTAYSTTMGQHKGCNVVFWEVRHY
jgi:hypothetical protein